MLVKGDGLEDRPLELWRRQAEELTLEERRGGVHKLAVRMMDQFREAPSCSGSRRRWRWLLRE